MWKGGRITYGIGKVLLNYHKLPELKKTHQPS